MTRFDDAFANVPTRALVAVADALTKRRGQPKGGPPSLIAAAFSAMPRDEWDDDWRERRK